MNTRRGPRFNKQQFDTAVSKLLADNARLVAENKALVRAVEYRDGLLDTAYTRMETLARETGRMDALGQHPSLRSGESKAGAIHPPGSRHLSVVKGDASPVTSTEGKQT